MITALRTLFVACLCATVIVSGCASNGADNILAEQEAAIADRVLTLGPGRGVNIRPARPARPARDHVTVAPGSAGSRPEATATARFSAS
jgi:hypothetical protein